MKKIITIATILFLLIIPLCFASLSEHMDNVKNHVNDYNQGKMDAAKLVVYLDYEKNKMYGELDKLNRHAFNEEEIKEVFEYSKNGELTKKYTTDDFNIIFTANQFFRRDREYYEDRDDESNYYNIYFNLEPAKVSKDFDLKDKINDFVKDLKNAAEDEDVKLDSFKEKLSEIKNYVRDLQDCSHVMQEIMNSDTEDRWEEKHYYLNITQEYEENCWEEQDCKEVCEEYEDCWDEWNQEENCWEECFEQEVCQEVTQGNETTQECHNETVCDEECEQEDVSEEVCQTREDCHMKCEPYEICQEHQVGEIRLDAHCNDDFSDIHVSAHGPTFESFQRINDIEWKDECEDEVQSLIRMRKPFEKSMNNNFAKWYFEQFLNDEPERLLNGDGGFKRVLNVLIRIEEQIAEKMHCTENKEWPKGFDNIDITYSNDHTNIEVWEKRIPVEWEDNTKYWSTLYKYSWVPDKSLIKKVIDYKLSEMNTIGPSAEDISNIRNDQGKMEIITRLAEKYDGSFDVNLKLLQDEQAIVEKYLRINPDDVIVFEDNLDEKPDISITVDYDVLYDFIKYMQFTMEGNDIQGPRWVHVEDEDGPGKVFSAIGAVSKMWRQGVTISPRPSLFKLFFSVGDIFNLMSQVQDVNNMQYQETQSSRDNQNGRQKIEK